VSGIPSRVQKAFDNPFVVVGGITLFGALLRLYHLGFKPLWFDEAVLYWISNSGNIEQVIAQNAARNSAPPLFAILVNFTLKIGDSEMILRLFPWLGGVAAIPTVYFLSRQFVGRTCAYFTTLVAAITLTQVWYSQQLREYTLTFLAATIILALFYRQLRRPTWSNWLLMTLAMVVGIFLQYGLAMLVIALNLVCAIELWYAKGARKSLIIRWSAAQIIVLGAVALCHTDFAQLDDWSILEAIRRPQRVLYAQEVYRQTQSCRTQTTARTRPERQGFSQSPDACAPLA
jgi:uncharacterized membrane protein